MPAATQLARYVAEHSPDADDAAENTTADIEAFQAGIIETRPASTAVNKQKCLHQFFKWLMLDEEEIDRSPPVALCDHPLIPPRPGGVRTAAEYRETHSRRCVRRYGERGRMATHSASARVRCPRGRHEIFRVRPVR
ncbi:hypothetical protein LCD31_18890 [Saccharopolyspora sp. 6M]|nr:hypothetical protein [Saccharopolyspora sp. 6M]MCA1278282.1 hypothetical protein [Saccharopolyspora sp. 7B]